MNSSWRMLPRSGSFMSGFLIVAFWTLCAVCGRRVVPFDPFEDDILNALAAPSLTHWFGTDQLGRDVLSRVIVGARDILLVAPLATALGVALGVILGLVTGYFRGIIDEAPEITADQSENHAERDPERGRERGDQQNISRADDDPREHVAAELVRAEPVRAGRRCERI